MPDMVNPNDRADDVSALKGTIRERLKERNAILLAHNYQPPEIQDIADLCGDSLELSMRAARTEADVIVFCGVHFMAETASILCPNKKVLLPVPSAGCPMADMITVEGLRKRKAELADVVVISYVNTTAEVKAESDLCCTSANAIAVANSVSQGRTLFMTPDRNLARYTRKHTGRDIRYWDGFCPIHDDLTVEDVRRAREAHPGALFIAHPECRLEVLDLADAVRSTSGMIAYAGTSKAREFIIGTEVGILHPLSKAHPGKRFVPASNRMVCPDMKKIGLQHILSTLETLEPEVKVPKEIADRARGAVERMLRIPVS
jgi:quinolinate synthase